MIRHIKRIFGSKRTSFVEKRELDSLKNNILASFANIKEDSTLQKRWINHLYNNHKDLESLQSSLKEFHSSHEKAHGKDIENVNRWIGHLHESSKRHDDNIKRLESNVASAFEKYNKYLIDLFRIVSDLKTSHEVALESKSESIIPPPETSASSVFEEKRSAPVLESYVPVDSVEESFDLSESREEDESDTPLKHYSKILTRAEKNVIAELCKTTQKLSYKDISIVTGLSVSTVKNHICHIKNKTFPIMESNDRTGVKRYHVSENIKKVLLSGRI